MGSRRKARVLAFQALYAWEFNPLPVEDITSFAWLDSGFRDNLDEGTFDFSKLIVAGTIENLDFIDREIETHLDNWDFTRLSKVELAILRLSAFSLLYQKDIPPSVTIDEAVDIAKDFGSEDAYRFVNGVLDGIRKANKL